MSFMLTLLVFVACVCVVISVYIKGNCSVSSHVQFNVTGDRRGDLDCTMYNTEACRNGLLPSHIEGPTAASPESMDVDGYLVRDPYPRDSQSPKLFVEWTMPRNAENLKGFRIDIRKYELKNGTYTDICRVFDLSATRFDPHNTKLKFQKPFYLRGGKFFYYRVEVKSLPYSLIDGGNAVYFSLPGQQKGIARDWTPFITYDQINYTEPASLSLRFKLAERHYGIESYKIYMVDDKDRVVSLCIVSTKAHYVCGNRTFQPVDHNDSSVKVTFTAVPSGEYYMQIQPENPENVSKCLCYDDNRECRHCMTAKTPKFLVMDASPVVTTPSYSSISYVTTVTKRPADEKHTTWYIGWAVFGFLAVLAVLVTGVFLYLKKGFKRRSTYTEEMLRLNNTPAENPDGKSILLLNTEDHDHHKNAITAFAFYLNNQCGFRVYYLPWAEGQIGNTAEIEWLQLKMKSADFIIVVNSRIAFTTYQSRMTESVSPSVFNFGISHMKANTNYFQKYNFINFDYTSSEHCIRDFNPSKEYKIPDDLTGLLENLCGGSEIHMDRFGNSCETIALLEAITRARHYEQSNPNWYKQRHHDVVSNSESLLTIEAENESGNDEHVTVTHLAGIPITCQFRDPSETGTGVSTEAVEEQLFQITRNEEICNHNATFHPPVIGEPPLNTADSIGTAIPSSTVQNGYRYDVTAETTTSPDPNLMDNGFSAPSLSNISEASTGYINERFDEINRQSEGFSLPHVSDGRVESVLDSTKFDGLPRDLERGLDARSDVSFPWKAPSTVYTDTTANTSVIVNNIHSINNRKDMNRASSSLQGSVSQNDLNVGKL